MNTSGVFIPFPSATSYQLVEGLLSVSRQRSPGCELGPELAAAQKQSDPGGALGMTLGSAIS